MIAIVFMFTTHARRHVLNLSDIFVINRWR